MSQRLVSYLRVSTKGQQASGLGLEGQEAAISTYAKATGGNVVATFTEVESGRKADRPELARAIAHAKRAGAVLVVAKLDRLSRNVAFLSALMADGGIEFVACDNPTANRLTIHILAAVAEDEARRISERTKAALAAYKARGGVLGSHLVGCHLTAEDGAIGRANGNAKQRQDAAKAYADLVPDIVRWRADGWSLQAIADRLNETTPTRKGGVWTATTVRRVLVRSGV